MTNLIPLNLDANLPAHLAGEAARINSDLGSKPKPKFPFMSLEGKQWTIVRGKDDTETLVNDEGDPRSAIEVVILRVNKAESKVYYEGQYVKGSNAKPTCYSNNGERPESDSADPQSVSCAKCPHNEWGTGPNGKGFACRGSKRIAIAAPDKLDDPMLVRVPPTSITPLREYNKSLRNYPYNSVVTRIKFDMSSPTPLLTFTPVGGLPPEVYAEAKAMYDSALVKAIIGMDDDGEVASTEDITPTPAVTQAKVTEALQTPAPTPAEKSKPAAKKAAVVATNLDDELDSALSGIDI